MTRSLILTAILLFVTLMPHQALAVNLESHRWKHRVLIVTAQSLADISYQRQAAELVAAFSDLLVRDMVLESEFGHPEFSIVLIGKDGTEKLRRNRPITAAEIFALIDAMPMRQAEMRSEQPNP